jgi:hypothetical protein
MAVNHADKGSNPLQGKSNLGVSRDHNSVEKVRILPLAIGGVV